MNGRMQCAVTAATLALAIVSAAGLAATSAAVEDHVAMVSAMAAVQLLP